jgi:hypothetical protein
LDKAVFASFTAHAVANLLFGVIFCRSTGRVHLFTIHVKELEKESSWKSPFMPNLTDLDVLLSFLKRMSRGGESDSLASNWTTRQQFKVPRACCHLAAFEQILCSICENAVGVANNLKKFSCLEHSQPKNNARNDAVLAVKRLLDFTLEQVDRNLTTFLAVQIIADFGEFWDCPFGPIKRDQLGSSSSWFIGHIGEDCLYTKE